MVVQYCSLTDVSRRVRGPWAKPDFMDADSGVSQAQKARVYLSDTSQYTAGDLVRVTDNTQKTGEDKEVDSVVDDDYVVLTTNMTKDYTTALQGKLQLKSMFGNRTEPSKEDIEAYINAAEGKIDHDTHHAWRELSVSQEPWNLDATYLDLSGIPIKLIHRKIKEINGVSGDKIEVWDGSSWVDYVATKNIGRRNDYWLDYESGILFLRLWFIPYITLSVRVTYRYGEAVVPEEIRRATYLLAAADVLDDENFVAHLPAGDLNIIEVGSKQKQWKYEAKKIIEHHIETFHM